MAKPGPPKTPSAVNELRGNPGHRPSNAEEPKPTVVASIAAPAWLKAEAREVWSELAPELKRLGLLTVIDVQVLAGACRWWAIYRKADRVLAARGLTARTPSNGRQAAPELAIADKAFKAATDVFSRFGITPSDRTSLQAPQPKEAGNGGGDEAPKNPHDELARRRAARAQRGGTAS